MEKEQIKAIAENILLAADEPVSVDKLQTAIMNGTPKAELRAVLEELKEEYRSRNLQIVEVADGYQLCTRHDYAEWIRKFLKLDKTTRLTQPSLDTLSIIAYKQPLTRAEVEEIRGVDSGGVLRTLLDKKIIAPGGRKKVPGRPIMYKTTRKFLEYFGLKDLSDLPTLEDFKEGELEGEREPDTQVTISFDEADPVGEEGEVPETSAGEEAADAAELPQGPDVMPEESEVIPEGADASDDTPHPN